MVLKALSESLGENLVDLNIALRRIFLNLPPIAEVKKLISEISKSQPFRVRTIVEVYLMDGLLVEVNGLKI